MDELVNSSFTTQTHARSPSLGHSTPNPKLGSLSTGNCKSRYPYMNLMAGPQGPAQTPSQNVIDYLYQWSGYVATCGQHVVVNAMVEFELTLVKARLGRLKKA